MKERTMNGLPIKEVWERLKADFPQDAIKRHGSTGREYIPVELIEKRLNDVVGAENWDFIVESSRVYRFGDNGRESCVVCAKLILYDDERVPVIRSTCGASDCIYPKEGNSPTSVANTVDSAVQDAFKRCAKRFGVAKIDKKEPDRGRQGDRAKEQAVKVLVLEPFKGLPRGGARAKVSLDGKTYALVIWQPEWENLAKQYADKFRIGGKLNEMHFVGIFKEYRGEKQIEFVRLAGGCGTKAGAA